MKAAPLRQRVASWGPAAPAAARSGAAAARGGARAARLLGVGQRVGAAVVRDGDVALLDVDVGRAVLAHRAQLHQVALRRKLLRPSSGAVNARAPRLKHLLAAAAGAHC